MPEDLFLKCRNVVEEGGSGYTAVSELVKDATRRRLEELEEQRDEGDA